MRSEQGVVEWVEAQSDQALVAPLRFPADPNCASSASVLQDLMRWWHCVLDEVALEPWLQHPRDRTVPPLPVRDRPCDQWRDVLEMLERPQGNPSYPPASLAAGNTELVVLPTSELLMLVVLQAVTVVVVVAAVAAAVVVVGDRYVLGVILRTDLTLQKSEVPCRGTEGWGTYEARSRGRDGERTAALCEGRAALEDAGTESGVATGR